MCITTRYILASEFLPLIISNEVPICTSVKTAILGLWLKANGIESSPFLSRYVGRIFVYKKCIFYVQRVKWTFFCKV